MYTVERKVRERKEG